MNNLTKLQIIFENLTKAEVMDLTKTIKEIGLKYRENIKEISMGNLTQEETLTLEEDIRTLEKEIDNSNRI